MCNAQVGSVNSCYPINAMQEMFAYGLLPSEYSLSGMINAFSFLVDVLLLLSVKQYVL